MMSSTTNSRIIKADKEVLYKACTTPEALAVWLAPGNMTGRVHHFNLKEGGGYEMSLYYPATTDENLGKTSAKEDRFKARFVALQPYERIVQAIIFDSENPAFSGEMTMEIRFVTVENGTKVTFLFTNIPVGINPEDNEKGTEESLEKLAKYVD